MLNKKYLLRSLLLAVIIMIARFFVINYIDERMMSAMTIATGIAMLLFWYASLCLVFSALAPSILKEEAKKYSKKDFWWLPLFKLLMTKESYEQVKYLLPK